MHMYVYLVLWGPGESDMAANYPTQPRLLMVSVLLSSNVALFGGNSTKPGSSYYALIKAVLSLLETLLPASLARVITR